MDGLRDIVCGVLKMDPVSYLIRETSLGDLLPTLAVSINCVLVPCVEEQEDTRIPGLIHVLAPAPK